ncbi:MAG: UDP-N-acetylmuramate dehydrogenase [Patescibacteria group bacterium]
MEIKEHISLSNHSTMKVGGNARYLAEAKSKADIKEAVSFAKAHDLPIVFIGAGSNMLFSDVGFHGLVIKIASKGIKIEDDSVTAEAGEVWDDFVAYTLFHGLYGLENLSGIPGSVGAAPIQNIGAYGIEAGESIQSVEVFDIGAMEFRNLSKEECGFGYRDSIFKKPEGKNLIVASVAFKLSKTPFVRISYKDLANHFGANLDPSPIDVRSAVIDIRKKKFPDLEIYGTAGSFFKNVICDSAIAYNLKLDYPELPVFDAAGGMKKISTAFILDKICGLRGFREGNVGLFENQSLVVVNFGGANSDEIKKFISKIKKIVKEKAKIDLEEEVVVL